MGKKTLLAALCALLALAGTSPSASAAPGLPTVEATLTIAGTVSGSQTVRYPGVPGEEGCPALAPTSYSTNASLSVHVVYKKILIPLKKLASPRAAARAGAARSSRPGLPAGSLRIPVPTSSGGPQHGAFSFSGDFYEGGPESGPCFALHHYASAAALSQSKKHRPHPVFTTSPPAFYDIGLGVDQETITAQPSTFEVPYGQQPQRVTESLPFFLPVDQLFFPAHGSKAVRVGWGEIGMEWNDLQGKLRKLRHRRSITIPADGSYSTSRPIGYLGGYGEDCNDADRAEKNGSEQTTCSETTSARYTVTIHRDRILVLH